MAGVPQRPQRRQAVTDLPRLDPVVHAPQVALVRFLGEQDPHDFFDQNECLSRMSAVRNTGNGIERLTHLCNDIGVLERQYTNGLPGKFFRLSEIGRQVFKRLPPAPKVSEIRDRAREAQQDQPAEPAEPAELTYSSARAELKRLGLRADGTKAEVFARLKAATDGAPPPQSPLKEASTVVGPAGRKPGRTIG